MIRLTLYKPVVIMYYTVTHTYAYVCIGKHTFCHCERARAFAVGPTNDGRSYESYLEQPIISSVCNRVGGTT